MILRLLFSGLVLGLVEAQTANMTAAELSGGERNQTFSESTADYSTMTAGDVTSGPLEEQRSRVEDELKNNQTLAVITEDDESFQDQESELPARLCQQELLEEFSHSLCGESFHVEMMSVSTDDWCVLKSIIRPYNRMTTCLETLSNLVGCYYPNPVIQEFFLDIHSFYFHNCSNEVLEDAPQGLVIALTLVPVSLIPVLVYLVVWKVQE